MLPRCTSTDVPTHPVPSDGAQRARGNPKRTFALMAYQTAGDESPNGRRRRRGGEVETEWEVC